MPETRTDPANGDTSRACALCGRVGVPLALSLTTLEPGEPARRRVVWACQDCATAAPSYTALVVALMRRAAPSPPPAADPPWTDEMGE